MRHLTTQDVTAGLRVIYLGSASAGDVLDGELRASGRILMPGHPGTIREILGLQHVIVQFVGLEAEPVSWAVGFGCDELSGVYPSLGFPTDQEWDVAITSGWWGATEGK